MPLIRCKECGLDDTSTKKTCPNCGSPKAVSGRTFGKWLFFLTIGAAILWIVYTESDRQQKEAPARAKAEADCKQDLKCWGDKHTAKAAIHCKDHIEGLAKFSFKWTYGMLEPMFSHVQWNDKASGTLTYVGDNIRFQNGFGAMQKHTYSCTIKPQTGAVITVEATPGSL